MRLQQLQAGGQSERRPLGTREQPFPVWQSRWIRASREIYGHARSTQSSRLDQRICLKLALRKRPGPGILRLSFACLAARDLAAWRVPACRQDARRTREAGFSMSARWSQAGAPSRPSRCSDTAGPGACGSSAVCAAWCGISIGTEPARHGNPSATGVAAVHIPSFAGHALSNLRDDHLLGTRGAWGDRLCPAGQRHRHSPGIVVCSGGRVHPRLCPERKVGGGTTWRCSLALGNLDPPTGNSVRMAVAAGVRIVTRVPGSRIAKNGAGIRIARHAGGIRRGRGAADSRRGTHAVEWHVGRRVPGSRIARRVPGICVVRHAAGISMRLVRSEAE